MAKSAKIIGGSVSETKQTEEMKRFIENHQNCCHGIGRGAARALNLRFNNQTGKPPLPWKKTREIMKQIIQTTAADARLNVQPPKFFKLSLAPRKF